MKRFCAPLLLLASSASVFAQDPTATPIDTATAAAGLAICGMGLLIPLIALAINIALMIWVGKDAKAKGMENRVLWMVLTFFTGLIGLIIYLIVRPKTNIPPSTPA
jgi:hypothetical protein